jgi:hypothetical protein
MAESHDRKPILWCSRCRRPDPVLSYLSDGSHYCWDCAEVMHKTRGLENAGKREGDFNPWG